MKVATGTALALLLSASTAAATAPTTEPVADEIVAEVIRIARTQALHGDRPDWPAVERDAAALLAATPGEDGRTAAIRQVLRALDDGHSFYQPKRVAAEVVAPTGSDTSTLRGRPIAQARTASGRIGELAIHAWAGPQQAIPVATLTVRNALIDALPAQACGLVIDVSANGGGNMWPMMGGIAPLYDNGTLETFEGRNGARQVVNVRDGALHMGDSPYPRVDLPALPQRPRYVALVIGPRTASSGEILALGFKGQANVRMFGQPTAGATTANSSRQLGNGGLLAITTSRILDRGDRHHQGPVLPDVTTDDGVSAARQWLAERCARSE